jgi:hypothetical protein
MLPRLVGKHLNYWKILPIEVNKLFIRTDAYVLTVIQHSTCFRRKSEAYQKMENYRRDPGGDAAS